MTPWYDGAMRRLWVDRPPPRRFYQHLKANGDDYDLTMKEKELAKAALAASIDAARERRRATKNAPQETETARQKYDVRDKADKGKATFEEIQSSFSRVPFTLRDVDHWVGHVIIATWGDYSESRTQPIWLPVCGELRVYSKQEYLAGPPGVLKARVYSRALSVSEQD
ncbi:hypothetical protein KEM56_005010 [Ascosphaera pollenicola]|nr:hypothetical protein KEM56_005010 [Ascosphaera pollenicola]